MGEHLSQYRKFYGKGGLLEEMMRTSTAPSARTRAALGRGSLSVRRGAVQRQFQADLVSPWRPPGVSEADILAMDPDDVALMFEDERVKRTTTYGRLLGFAQGISTGVTGFFENVVEPAGNRFFEDQGIAPVREVQGVGKVFTEYGPKRESFSISAAQIASGERFGIPHDYTSEAEFRKAVKSGEFEKFLDLADPFRTVLSDTAVALAADIASVVPRFTGNFFRLFSGEPAARRSERVDLGFAEFSIHGKVKAGGIMTLDLLEIVPGVKFATKGVRKLFKIQSKVGRDVLSLPSELLPTPGRSATEGAKALPGPRQTGLLSHEAATAAAERAAQVSHPGFGFLKGPDPTDVLALPSPADVATTLRASALQSRLKSVGGQIDEIEQARASMAQTLARGGVVTDELGFLDDIVTKIEGVPGEGTGGIVRRVEELLQRRSELKVKTGNTAARDLDIEAEIDALLGVVDQLHAMAAIGPGAKAGVQAGRAARRGTHAVQKGRSKLALRKWGQAEDLRLKRELQEALGMEQKVMEQIAACLRRGAVG